MSHRPTINKQIARLRKQMRTKLPATIDLTMWLQDHKYAQTAGEARRMLADGRVKAGEHIVGRGQVTVFDEKSQQPVKRWVAQPAVPATLRADLTVS